MVKRKIMRRWARRGGTWWWTTAVIATPVLAITGAAVWSMLVFVPVADAKDRIELVKLALGVGAGTGGVVALILTRRRQWSTEQADEHTRHDAAERRITELYTKAADQLGSDKAAVRLAGLYALERLGQNTTGQREAIGNVLCAYLRMPYHPPRDALPEEADQDARDRNDARAQERETRQAALDILTRHNRKDQREQHWPEIIIRLQRANLAGMNLHGGTWSSRT